ncbi:hypothetical protein DB346_04270 [Verrucomicrobia bacterium LW23]|nr:hypothetical protein DB346_04270 [Verrucomicrobia bacterium LW23]
MTSLISLRRHWIVAAASAWCFLWIGGAGRLHVLHANPSGGSVQAGSARIENSPGQVTIRQSSDRSVVHWNDFSISRGETTTFVQPGTRSATLNRVTGSGTSHINGSLNANGRVYLVNPNGVVVGKTGRVNTAGFTASTHDVSNAEFMKGGDMNFSGNSRAKVVNYGKIKATDGDVTLIARQVENHGRLSARGRVQLAAGTEVLIKSDGAERVFIKPGSRGAEGETGIINTGKVRAAVAELKAAGGNEYALAINNSGIIRATGSRTESGRVYLSSTGGGIVNSGKIRATNRNGSGGEIRIAGGDIKLKSGSVLDASGSRKGKGGNGGKVYVGGEWQGGGTMAHAKSVTMEKGAEIRADATAGAGVTTPANGGEVVLWSTDITDFNGAITARGVNGGLGGKVETSGYRLNVGMDAMVLTDGGTWLLDPENIEIIGSAGTHSDVNTLPALGDVTIQNSVISTALNTQHVILLASQSITVSANVAAATAGTFNLTLDAPEVFLNAAITMRAGTSLLGGAGTMDVEVGANGRVQNGLDVVAAGGTVKLAAATYTENVVVRKSMTIEGAGTDLADPANRTTIAGAGTAAAPTSTVMWLNVGSTDVVNLSGFQLTNGRAINTGFPAPVGGSGLRIENGTVVADNLLINRNLSNRTGATYVGAGVLVVAGNVTFENSRIIDNNLDPVSGLKLTTGTGSGGGIYLNSGTLTIRDSVVSNNGTAVSGGGLYLLNGTVLIENSDISNNSAQSGTGGGIAFIDGSLQVLGSTVNNNLANSINSTGGGIYRGNGSLTVADSTISGNRANADTSGGSGKRHGGGGIYSTGNGAVSPAAPSKIIVARSVISNNTAVGTGGGVHIQTPNVTETGAIKVEISDTIFSGNSAQASGGGFAYVRTVDVVQINNSVFVNNTTAGNGGGISFGSGSVGGSAILYLSNTSIYGNQANLGGGIYLTFNNADLANVTIANNTATLAGGGIRVNFPATLPNTIPDPLPAYLPSGVRIMNSTITGNHVTTPTGADGYSGGSGGGISRARHNSSGSANTSHAISLANTILAGNTVATATGVEYQDYSGSLTDFGHNVFGIGLNRTPPMGEGPGGTQPGNLPGVIRTPKASSSTGITDPGLSTLGYYGGGLDLQDTTLFLTAAPLPGSIAIDKGNASLTITSTPVLPSPPLVAPLVVPSTDQRGLGRVGVAGTVDAGAVEAQGFTYSAADANATLLQAFDPIVVTVTPNHAGDPVAGGTFSIVLPGSGASATGTTLATIAADGTATFNLTANGTAGGPYAVTVDGATAFNLTNDRIVLTVAPTGTLSKVYGDATPDAPFGWTVTSSNFMLGDDAGNVFNGGSLSRVAGEVVASYAITNGTLAVTNSNYTFVIDSSYDFDITKRAITVTANDKTSVYGDAIVPLTFTATGLVGSDTESNAFTGALAMTGSNAGNYDITQNTLDAANYSITFVTGNYEITRRAVTVTADAKTSVYGDAIVPLTFTASGLVGSDTESNAFTGALAMTETNAGSHAITQNTLDAANYAITYVGANYVISKRAVDITAHAQTSVYGDAIVPLTFTASGLVGTDTETNAFNGGLGMSQTNAGTHAILQNTLDSDNYTINSYTGANYTITPAMLTVTANDANMLAGQALPTFSGVITGFRYTDNESVVGGLAYSTSATSASPVGSYAIVPGGASALNYTFTYVNGNLTIAAAPPVPPTPGGGGPSLPPGNPGMPGAVGQPGAMGGSGGAGGNSAPVGTGGNGATTVAFGDISLIAQDSFNAVRGRNNLEEDELVFVPEAHKPTISYGNPNGNGTGTALLHDSSFNLTSP